MPLTHPTETTRRFLGLLARFALLVYFIVILCPIQFFPFKDYGDLSWVLAINAAADMGLRHGEDLFWTYGPFGYLGSPVPIGDNLSAAFAYQWLLWAGAAIVAIDFIFIQKRTLAGTLALTACAAIGWPLHHNNFGGSENIIVFLAYCLLASSIYSANWVVRLVFAAILCGFVALIKFSAFVAVCGAMAGTIFVLFLRSRRQGVKAALIAAAATSLSFLGLYMLHNPSLTGLIGFIWGAQELSVGYASAMSSDQFPIDFTLKGAAAVAGFTAVIVYESRRLRDQSVYLSFVFAVPLLVGLKHMLVRLDYQHVPNFFCVAAAYMGLMIAFREGENATRAPGWIAFIAGSSIVLFFTHFASLYGPTFGPRSFAEVFSGSVSLEYAKKSLNVRRTEAAILQESAEELKGKRLPPGIRHQIGDRPVAIFGSEFPFAVIDRLNLRLMPVPQLYSVYTPALDQRCADWFQSDAPDLVLMSWRPIDNRHPLTQAPRSWLAVWRWYDADLLEKDWLLLRRRTAARFGEPVSLGATVARADEPLRPAFDQQPLLIRVRRPLSVAGHLAQIGFKIPPLLAEYGRGEFRPVQYRSVVGVLDYPAMFRPLPTSLEEVALLLADKPLPTHSRNVETFAFSGAEAYYAREYDVGFYTFEGIAEAAH